MMMSSGWWWTSVVSAFLLFLSSPVAECVQCKFDFWDDDQIINAIHPVPLRCREGSISWHWARSALYIRPHSSLLSNRLCVHITTNGTAVAFTRFLGKVMETRAIVSGSKPVEMCMDLVNQTLLLVEPASSSPSPPWSQVTVEYVAEEIVPNTMEDECQPCSERDFIKLFCTGDFALLGLVTDVLPGKAPEPHHIRVKPARVHHQSSPVFRKNQSDIALTLPAACTLPTLTPALVSSKRAYVFVGRLRFERASLQCMLELRAFESLAQRKDTESLCSMR